MAPASARKALASLILFTAYAGMRLSAEDTGKEKALTLEVTLVQKKVLKLEQDGSLIHPRTCWKGRLTFKIDRIVSGTYKKSECLMEVSESSIVINSQWRGENFWQRTEPGKRLRIHFSDRKPAPGKIECIEEFKKVDGKETWHPVTKYEEPIKLETPLDLKGLKLDLTE